MTKKKENKNEQQHFIKINLFRLFWWWATCYRVFTMSLYQCDTMKFPCVEFHFMLKWFTNNYCNADRFMTFMTFLVGFYGWRSISLTMQCIFMRHQKDFHTRNDSILYEHIFVYHHYFTKNSNTADCMIWSS